MLNSGSCNKRDYKLKVFNSGSWNKIIKNLKGVLVFESLRIYKKYFTIYLGKQFFFYIHFLFSVFCAPVLNLRIQNFILKIEGKKIRAR